MPDATTKSIPTDYIEEPEFPGGVARRWEDERLHSAVFKPGAKDAKVSVFKILFNFLEPICRHGSIIG